MHRAKGFAGALFSAPAVFAFALVFVAAAAAGETAAPQPHMMYFYNPSCRLCTGTNEVVGAVEGKFAGALTSQRFDISDPETGAGDVMYLFDLMDEMQVPETDDTTLVVFLGLLETIDGDVYFTPKRVLVDGENIMEKLDAEVTDFLAGEGKVASAGKGGSARGARFFPAA